MPYSIQSDPDGFYVENTDTKEKMNKKPFKTMQEAKALKAKLDASEGLGKGKVLPKKEKETKKAPALPKEPNIADLIAQQGPPQGSPMVPGGPMMGGSPMMGPGGPNLPAAPLPFRG